MSDKELIQTYVMARQLICSLINYMIISNNKIYKKKNQVEMFSRNQLHLGLYSLLYPLTKIILNFHHSHFRGLFGVCG